MGALAAATNLRMSEMGTRIWFEWVGTASNPADGLSRAGSADAWTQARGWQLWGFPQGDLKVIQEYLTTPPRSKFLPRAR